MGIRKRKMMKYGNNKRLQRLDEFLMRNGAMCRIVIVWSSFVAFCGLGFFFPGVYFIEASAHRSLMNLGKSAGYAIAVIFLIILFLVGSFIFYRAVPAYITRYYLKIERKDECKQVNLSRLARVLWVAVLLSIFLLHMLFFSYMVYDVSDIIPYAIFIGTLPAACLLLLSDMYLLRGKANVGERDTVPLSFHHSSQREKMRSMFLCALMILSIVGLIGAVGYLEEQHPEITLPSSDRFFQVFIIETEYYDNQYILTVRSLSSTHMKPEDYLLEHLSLRITHVSDNEIIFNSTYITELGEMEGITFVDEEPHGLISVGDSFVIEKGFFPKAGTYRFWLESPSTINVASILVE